MTLRIKKCVQIIALLIVMFVMCSAAYGADSPELLREVRNFVKENYILPVDEKVLRQDTAQKIIEALGDPHSEYLSPEEFKNLMERTSGYYTGVGIELTLQQYGDTVYPVVVSTLPAARPTRQASSPATGLSLWTAVALRPRALIPQSPDKGQPGDESFPDH